MRLEPACLAAAVALVVSATSVALAQRVVPAIDEDDGGVPEDAAPIPVAPDAGVAATAIVPHDDEATAPTGPPLPPGVGPVVWAESSGRRCHRYRGRRICEGPRRVPEPSPEALERQRALGLDQARVAHAAMRGELPSAWAEAAPGEPGADLLWPVAGGRLWRGFGRHRRLARTRSGRLRRLRRSHLHEGVDIGADPGTPILAANDGLVAYSDNGMRGYGNAVVLVHRDGTVTLYAHCSATFVAAGELVRRGRIIAAVGATGLAHGPHLHFEWRSAGRARDPLRHFVERPDRPAAAPPADDGEPDDAHEPVAEP